MNHRIAPSDAPRTAVILVTGPAGAGRFTALRGLEDIGFEAIDNLPLALMPRLFDGPTLTRPTAIGIDTRTRGFSVEATVAQFAALEASDRYDAEILYLDCRRDVLLRRFSETRRRHPIAEDEPTEAAIGREVEMLAPLRDRAGVLLDTSEFSPHDLTAELARLFSPTKSKRLVLSLQSFSYKRGVPMGVDTVFDVRFLANPHWEESLRPLDGRDPRVAEFVSSDPTFAPFFEKARELILFLLPAYVGEGKSHFSLGFGCTGGQHRSVAVTEAIAKALADENWQVSIRHRELERRDKVAV